MKKPNIIHNDAIVTSFGESEVPVTFENWIGERHIDVLATNAGASPIAFQNWRKFKEAFAPELIQRAVIESEREVQTCLDPFGGSGTTSLACQFLGVEPTTIEVNPYLADLIEAKLSTYEIDGLAKDFSKIIRQANSNCLDVSNICNNLPPTFVEPGKNNRWIFDLEIAERIISYRIAIEKLKNKKNARLLRVLLGGILIEVSNVVISGKGRRYRRGWDKSRRAVGELDERFVTAVEKAIGDIVLHAERKELGYNLYRGDSRNLIPSAKKTDLIIFSPPYPNSFDYTDVYNVELWALGYLDNFMENKMLRLSTLSSHVQVKRDFSSAPNNSPLLDETIHQLKLVQDDLWDKRLVGMVGGYFSDMSKIMNDCIEVLAQRGEMWMVVGDSKYAGVPIPVAGILTELVQKMNCEISYQEPIRSMRTSAQQGGNKELAETLLVIKRK